MFGAMDEPPAYCMVVYLGMFFCRESRSVILFPTEEEFSDDLVSNSQFLQ